MGLTREQVDQCVNAFRNADRDGNGTLSEEEMIQVMSMLADTRLLSILSWPSPTRGLRPLTHHQLCLRA
jgi:hypothetical protein